MTRHKRLRQIEFGAAAVAGVLVVAVIAYHMIRVQRCDSIQTKIDGLVLHPPDNTSELEWAVHIYWTHNLHCNSLLLTQASFGSLGELDQMLDTATVNGPTLQTIDEIWRQYAKMTASGAKYQQKYETKKNEIANLIATPSAEYPYAHDYESFMQLVRSQSQL